MRSARFNRLERRTQGSDAAAKGALVRVVAAIPCAKAARCFKAEGIKLADQAFGGLSHINIAAIAAHIRTHPARVIGADSDAFRSKVGGQIAREIEGRSQPG